MEGERSNQISIVDKSTENRDVVIIQLLEQNEVDAACLQGCMNCSVGSSNPRQEQTPRNPKPRKK